ncbi:MULTISPECIES: winged helix family transcriptional regulator [unclassified Adlercreutzia]|uniref:winged helix family transcriptional regulator n=1 Tax=unclassified Adlercreutzia TaxID=2636013 RepID=UPI0013EDA949|nr:MULTISPECIES: winged helix family transcriptional regulator [unclassified Adlercreutzia]
MAQRKSVIFIADSLDNAHKFQQVLSGLDVDVAAGSSLQFKKLLSTHPNHDLVIYEARGDALGNVAQAEAMLVEDGAPAMLVIVNEGQLAEFRLPVQVKADFVVHGASAEECAARIRQLLWPGNESSTSDFITVDNMTINLATYQVKVAGEPLDLTYLEYALLAFLVTHPGRTYSRDALLRRVWGFDYYGGSRTVDVHVRRVRAKLGPELAQRLETVRGVGYLWSA